MTPIYSKYFNNWEVKPVFKKEFISIFNGWLGKDNYHKLDNVTHKEWSKFNTFINLLYNEYRLYLADCEAETCILIKNISEITQTYEEAMNKDGSQFLKLIIPQIDCVLSEEWDYTYILWYKNSDAIAAVSSLVSNAGLYQFHD